MTDSGSKNSFDSLTIYYNYYNHCFFLYLFFAKNNCFNALTALYKSALRCTLQNPKVLSENKLNLLGVNLSFLGVFVSEEAATF